MTAIDWLVAGICLALVMFAYWVGTGTLPGARLYRLYRMHRVTYNKSRLDSLRCAWFVWIPWL